MEFYIECEIKTNLKLKKGEINSLLSSESLKPSKSLNYSYLFGNIKEIKNLTSLDENLIMYKVTKTKSTNKSQGFNKETKKRVKEKILITLSFIFISGLTGLNFLATGLVSGSLLTLLISFRLLLEREGGDANSTGSRALRGTKSADGTEQLEVRVRLSLWLESLKRGEALERVEYALINNYPEELKNEGGVPPEIYSEVLEIRNLKNKKKMVEGLRIFKFKKLTGLNQLKSRLNFAIYSTTLILTVEIFVKILNHNLS